MPSFVKGRRARNAPCGICRQLLVFAGRFPGTPRARAAFFWKRGAPRFDTKETTMTKFLALIAATLLAFAAQAGDNKDKSHDKGMHTTATFDTLDKNADSQISKTEASSDSKLSDNFAALDTNGDGYLSKAEFMAKGKT
jgi:hypothetical protein